MIEHAGQLIGGIPNGDKQFLLARFGNHGIRDGKPERRNDQPMPIPDRGGDGADVRLEEAFPQHRTVTTVAILPQQLMQVSHRYRGLYRIALQLAALIELLQLRQAHILKQYTSRHGGMRRQPTVMELLSNDGKVSLAT